ncbi:lytic transglycosylase domain-containing protein [Novosphingobium sp. PC22D]|uniref:lytic transglycosylase domain-containing protein n=1 Tax=Novosphingobium sp. PC22D TaxID=1962403 RepID=UPI000BF13208|nr:lytic transglycosylase domain-containing protein [Novosphingobium sp. PC22D]
MAGLPSATAEPAHGTAGGHPYAVHVAEAARRFGIPEDWIWAVMRVESNGDRRAVSTAGAMGLMQIMPATWANLRVRYQLGSDPFDPRDNIMAGAAYLREMHDRYGSEAAMLAAYNAGPGRYEQYLSRGRPLPRETRAYLAKLTAVTGNSGYAKLAAAPPPDPFAWRRAGLFPARADGIPNTEDAVTDEASDSSPTAPPGAVEPPANGLFVSLSGQ